MIAPPSNLQGEGPINGIGDAVGSEKQFNRAIVELITNGTIEFTGGDSDTVIKAKEFLPFGKGIYIPSVPKQPLLSTIDRIRVIHEAGFDPVPHLAARRIASRDELQKFLRNIVNDFRVNRVLLIGGDLSESIGPYKDSASILRDTILMDTGIREIGIAGYPEGHPKIPVEVLNDDIKLKLELASKHGLGIYILTQFSFIPSRILDYCAMLTRTLPLVPVYIGMAGPTDPIKLIRYAKLCGVSASIRALSNLGFKAVNLVSHTKPDEQLTALARYYSSKETSNVIGVHIFSFGGFLQSAEWIQKMLRNSRGQ